MTARIEILDETGNVANVIIADESFAEELYPGRYRVAPSEPSLEGGQTEEGVENV